MKAGDDTLVTLDSLRWLLVNYDPEDPIYLGEDLRCHSLNGILI